MSTTGIGGTGSGYESHVPSSDVTRASPPTAEQPRSGDADAGSRVSDVTRDVAAMRLENGLSAGALRERLHAALAPEAAPEIGPIDLDAVRSGSVRFEMPLAPGTHELDVGGDEPLVLEVDEQTTLTFDAKITAGDQGPRVGGARLRFIRAVVITNSGALIDEGWEEIADALTDIEVRGLEVNEKGEVRVEGRIDGPLWLDEDLSKRLSPNKISPERFDLKHLLGNEPLVSAEPKPTETAQPSTSSDAPATPQPPTPSHAVNKASNTPSNERPVARL